MWGRSGAHRRILGCFRGRSRGQYTNALLRSMRLCTTLLRSTMLHTTLRGMLRTTLPRSTTLNTTPHKQPQLPAPIRGRVWRRPRAGEGGICQSKNRMPRSIVFAEDASSLRKHPNPSLGLEYHSIISLHHAYATPG